jgi:hypothetical protein
MMNSSTLHSALKATMQAKLNGKKKVQTIPGSNLKPEDGNVVPDSDLTTQDLGLGDGGKVMDLDPVRAEADMIDAFAEAIAIEIISHLKTNLQLTNGAATFTAQTAAGTWTGQGGGVVGPVIVNNGTGIAGNETLTVPPGKFE